MKSHWLTLILTCTCLIPATVQGQNHTEKGAALGGLIGALSGAAIGKQNGETTEGAVIGGALGLITGAAIGNSKDEELARQRAYQAQAHWRMSRAVSIQDVVTMQHGGLGDHVIINHIRQNGVQRRPEVSDVIALHKQGVSEAVITAMQQAPGATAYSLPVRPRPSPVIVQEYHYGTPHYYYGQPGRYYHPHYYRHHHHHRPGVHWGITIGH